MTPTGPIVPIGPPGSGKSTISALLADLLGRPFVHLDGVAEADPETALRVLSEHCLASTGHEWQVDDTDLLAEWAGQPSEPGIGRRHLGDRPSVSRRSRSGASPGPRREAEDPLTAEVGAIWATTWEESRPPT